VNWLEEFSSLGGLDEITNILSDLVKETRYINHKISFANMIHIQSTSYFAALFFVSFFSLPLMPFT